MPDRELAPNQLRLAALTISYSLGSPPQRGLSWSDLLLPFVRELVRWLVNLGTMKTSLLPTTTFFIKLVAREPTEPSLWQLSFGLLLLLLSLALAVADNITLIASSTGTFHAGFFIASSSRTLCPQITYTL